MGAITTALLTTAAVVGAGSTIMQGRAANQAAKAQAKSIEAEQLNKQNEFMEAMSRQREQSRRAIATIRARLAQTGTNTTQGTPLQILGESAGNIELGFQDAARRQMVQDQAMTGAATMTRWQGGQAQTGAFISAGGQLLGGAAQVGAYRAEASHLGVTKKSPRPQYKPLF